jgi:acyl-coenzyme A thioesterase PaaI-like protein
MSQSAPSNPLRSLTRPVRRVLRKGVRGPLKTVEKKVLSRVFSSPRAFERGLAIWPPLAGDGVRVHNVADDWSYGEVVLHAGPLTQNMHGAAFGGTLFAMTDFLFGTLVMKRLGRDYEAWTRTGQFQFLSPGKDGARMPVHVTDELCREILDGIAADGFYNVAFTCVITNRDGSVAGIGQQDLHVRPRKGSEAARTPGEPREVDADMQSREPRGMTLEHLVTAAAWRAWGPAGTGEHGVLTSVLSASRRIPDPEDQARHVCGEILSRGALTRDQLLELSIPERLLGTAGQ